MAYIIMLPTHKDNRGSLTVVEKLFPFQIKRVFYMYNSYGSIRGGHRHKKNIQSLISVSGSCIVSTNDGNKKEDFLLDIPEKCLIVEPKDWHTMHSFTKDAVLLVLASEYYDQNDYIYEGYE